MAIIKGNRDLLKMHLFQCSVRYARLDFRVAKMVNIKKHGRVTVGCYKKDNI